MPVALILGYFSSSSHTSDLDIGIFFQVESYQ